ncbi:AAA family ATPase [Asanoa iriomotensis]|uniref:LuxR family transcriptional regulator n=1 Tax=Asanoa iriomotensis TaxID=234613 RepID=A0ABQ4C7Z2_9ACTN|nr:LuxR family transcriptional regulator [Asanoa iriomotensis]GIF58880.1 LuxR family transcriptional regulator [Asanoa iriomotensis]
MTGPAGAHGWRHDAARPLFGRDPEIAEARAFVDRARVSGDALVLAGDPGVGKTVLLDAATDYAAAVGTRTARVTGSQFEVDVSFSGLQQVVDPFLDHLTALPEPQRNALRGALGLAEGGAADRFLVASAARALLVAAAATAPVLLVVDDLPWMDQASSMVLSFVARRVAGHRIGLLGALRTGDKGFFDHTGIRVLDLEPLSDEAAAELLADRFPALTSRVRQRLLADAQGNPLALLELPVALHIGSRPAPSALPATLPLTRRLQTVFAGRVRDLPEPTRHALLLAVLDGSGDLRVLTTGEIDRLGPAERTHLVSLDRAAARLHFRHPLIRSAIVELSTSDERRDVHRLLAVRRRSEPARRAWHLAEAATGPDERIAALLQQVAHTNLFRGDSVGAITELLRAADLSPAGTARSSRLAEAAYLGAIVTGDLRDVPKLLDAARDADPRHGGALAGAVAGAYHLLNENGDIDSAYGLLTGAIDALADPTDGGNKTLIEALYTLLMVCFFGGRPELWPFLHTAVDRLRPRPPQLLTILRHTFSDPAHLAHAVLDRLDVAIDNLRGESSPARIVRTAIAGSYLDRLGDCREPLWRAVRHGREGGAVTSAIEALFLLANDAYFTGRWDEVLTLTDEGLDLCESHHYRLMRWPGLFLRAMVAGGRGDEALSARLTEEMTAWAAPRRVGAVTAYVSHVRTLTALSRGAFDSAYRHASAVDAHAPNALWLVMETVEAAARSGRGAQAAAHVAAAERARIGALSSRLALSVAGAAAMASADDDHADLFARALATPDADRWPFDLARIRLAYGERLRRTGSPAAARDHLSAAIDVFDQLQAQPWASRAAHELRATGAHRERSGPHLAPTLTPQQHQIAALAAAGLSNKQIGERLFLSARTVGYHLHQIFPKLGIAARAALRDALADLPPPPDQ